MDRIVHHILSECDIEIDKNGDNVRIRFREKDPDLVFPTDFELEGSLVTIHSILSQAVQILESIRELDDHKEPD